MSADSADPLALILAAGSAAISLLGGIVVAMVSGHAKRIDARIEELTRQMQSLWVGATQLDGRARTAEAEISALKQNTLTRELFVERTSAQDEKLDKLDWQVAALDRGLQKRPTTSQMAMTAHRPVPRVDSDEPPPMRPRLPSRR